MMIGCISFDGFRSVSTFLCLSYLLRVGSAVGWVHSHSLHYFLSPIHFVDELIAQSNNFDMPKEVNAFIFPPILIFFIILCPFIQEKLFPEACNCLLDFL